MAALITLINVLLPTFGKADQRNVGHQLQFELQPAVLAVLALLGERRRPALVRQELGVAASTAASRRGQPTIAVVGQVGQQFAGVQIAGDGAFGNSHLQRLAPLAVLVLALAVHAILGPAVGMVAEGEQRRDVAIGDQPDVAALAPVAAVRSAHGLGTLTAERHTAGTAIAAAYIQLRFIDEPAHRTT